MFFEGNDNLSLWDMMVNPMNEAALRAGLTRYVPLPNSVWEDVRRRWHFRSVRKDTVITEAETIEP